MRHAADNRAGQHIVAGEEFDHVVEDHRAVQMGVGDIVDTHRPAERHIVDQRLLEMPLHLFRHVARGDRHIHAAKREIGAFQIGKVRAGFLDSGAGTLDQPQHHLQMVQNLGIDLRHAVEVCREADPDLWRGGDHRILEAATFRPRERDRDRGCVAGHAIEEQGAVPHRAGHRALRSFGHEACRAGAGGASRAGPHADDAAIGRRCSQAAAMIGPVAQPHLACGKPRRRAAGRSARIQHRVPRVQRRAEHRVEGVGAGAHFRSVCLAGDNAAARLDAGHQRIALVRHKIGKGPGAEGRANTGDRIQVLDAERQSGQPAGMGGIAVEIVRRRIGTFRTGCRHRVDGGLDGLDSRKGSVEAVTWADLALFQ